MAPWQGGSSFEGPAAEDEDVSLGFDNPAAEPIISQKERTSTDSNFIEEDDVSILNSEAAIVDLEGQDLIFSFLEVTYGFILRPCAVASEHVFSQKARRNYNQLLVYMSKAFGHNVPAEFQECVDTETMNVQRKLRNQSMLYVPRLLPNAVICDAKPQFSSEQLHDEVLPLTVYSTNYTGEINSKPLLKKRKCCTVGMSHILDYVQVLSFAWWRQRNPFGKMLFGLVSALLFSGLLYGFIVQFRDWKWPDYGQVHFFVFWYTIFLGLCTLHFGVFNLQFSKDRSLFINQLLYLYSQQWEHFLHDRVLEKKKQEEERKQRQQRLARALPNSPNDGGADSKMNSSTQSPFSTGVDSHSTTTGSAGVREPLQSAFQRSYESPETSPGMTTRLLAATGSYGTTGTTEEELANPALPVNTATSASIPGANSTSVTTTAQTMFGQQLSSADVTKELERPSSFNFSLTPRAFNRATANNQKAQLRAAGSPAPAEKLYGTYRGPFLTTVGSLPSDEQNWFQDHLYTSPEIQRQNWDFVQTLRRSSGCWAVLIGYSFLIFVTMCSISLAHWSNPGVLPIGAPSARNMFGLSELQPAKDVAAAAASSTDPLTATTTAAPELQNIWNVDPERDGFDPNKSEGVTDKEREAQAKFEENVKKHIQGAAPGEGLRWCRETMQYLPDNAHYCSYDKFVVLGRDHHCPWVGNCVGFGNYKFFILFLFWYWIMAVVGFFINIRAIAFYLLSDVCGDTIFRQRGPALTNFVAEQFPQGHSEWEYVRVLLFFVVKRNRYTDELDWSDESWGTNSSRSECKAVTSESEEDMRNANSSGAAVVSKSPARPANVPQLQNLEQMNKKHLSELSLKTRRYNRSFMQRKYGWNFVRYYLSGVFFNLSDVRIFALWMGLVWYGFCVGFVFLVGQHQLAQFTKGKMLGSWDKFAPDEHNTLYQNTCRWLGANPLLWFMPIPGTGNPHNGWYEPGADQWNGR
ncbi:unnamed protein product [Amoebophrya sp. A120]|nr:unnamed protein product [Amoebophrya sp. A120]|eukprot:GSA120T00004872001.1